MLWSMKEHFYWNMWLQQVGTTPKFVTRPWQNFLISTKKSSQWPKPPPTHPNPKNQNAPTTPTSKTGKKNTTAPNTTKTAAVRTRTDMMTKTRMRWTIMMRMTRWSMTTTMRTKKSQYRHLRREPSRWSWRYRMRMRSQRLNPGRWCIKTLLRVRNLKPIRSFRRVNKLRMVIRRISDALYYMNRID